MREIFGHQKYLMEDVYKISNDPKSRVDCYRTTTLAAVDELMEALHHVPWKPWSKREDWDINELHDELVDVFTFFVQLCHLAGMGPERLERGYFEKAKVNKDRQESGTYGVEHLHPAITQYQLDELYNVAESGECTTSRVGCLIVAPDGTELWGYNRAVDGHPCTHKASEGCPGRTIHAEISALMEAARKGVALEGGAAYITEEPCGRCLESLHAAGVEEVWEV